MTIPASSPAGLPPAALRRGSRRSPLVRTSVWGRVLALVLVFAFGRATVVPPCEAHLASRIDAGLTGTKGQAAHHEHTAAGERPEHGEHGADCTCLGACHNAPSAVWITSDPIDVRVGATVVRRVAPRPSSWAAIPRFHLSHVLPLATAPPTSGV